MQILVNNEIKELEIIDPKLIATVAVVILPPVALTIVIIIILLS